MSDPNTLDAFELDRLELFATQILLKALLQHIFNGHPDPQKLAESISSMFEDSVHLFELRGADGVKAQAARDYVQSVGQEMLAASLHPRSVSD